MKHLLKFTGFKKSVSFLILSAALTFAAPEALAAGHDGQMLVPMGNAVGITLKSDGVIVVGLSELDTESSSKAPGRDGGIVPGDVITQINSIPVSSAEDIRKAVSSFDGSPVTIRVRRGDKQLQLTVTPAKSKDGAYEMGLWLRDGMAGIGTLTFYDPKTGVFGALGHAISDTDTSILMPLREGSILRSTITDVIPSTSGSPGQLLGTFKADTVLGKLDQNTSCGIFGKMPKNDLTGLRSPVPVASAADIQLGEAVILSNISGTDVSEYKVEITRLYSGSESVGRSMMLTVTDPALLDKTGGIVQGMSGSPILQNGKLIGAVTHVLVNNPSKGYGIAIETMLRMAYRTKETLAAA